MICQNWSFQLQAFGLTDPEVASGSHKTLQPMNVSSKSFLNISFYNFRTTVPSYLLCLIISTMIYPTMIIIWIIMILPQLPLAVGTWNMTD